MILQLIEDLNITASSHCLKLSNNFEDEKGGQATFLDLEAHGKMFVQNFNIIETIGGSLKPRPATK